MKTLSLLIITLLTACSSAPTTNSLQSGKFVASFDTAISRPIGDFVLAPSDGIVEDQYLTSKVEGVSLRQTWKTLEPTEGNFNWTYLDREIKRLTAKGKKIMIHIKPGQDAPAWLYAKGVKKFTYVDDNPNHVPGKTSGCLYQKPCSIPIPWDNIYLSSWKIVQLALQQRYGANSSVVGYHLAGPTDNDSEMHLPKSDTDKANWKKAGYTVDKIVGAWEKVCTSFKEAFPTKVIVLNFSPIIWNDGAKERVLKRCQELLGPSIGVQHNALSAKVTEAYDVHKTVKNWPGFHGYQMLCPHGDTTRFGGTWAQAMTTAGTTWSYLEIYKGDVSVLK